MNGAWSNVGECMIKSGSVNEVRGRVSWAVRGILVLRMTALNGFIPQKIVLHAHQGVMDGSVDAEVFVLV